MIVAENDILLIRQIQKSDAKVLFEIYSDAEAMKYRANKSFVSLDEVKLFIESIPKKIKNKQEFRFAIVEKQTMQLIGTFVYTPISKTSCKIGYSLGKQHWGKGFATEALKIMFLYLQNQKFKTYLAIIHKENLASIALIQKFNFKLIATEKNLTFELKI